VSRLVAATLRTAVSDDVAVANHHTTPQACHERCFTVEVRGPNSSFIRCRRSYKRLGQGARRRYRTLLLKITTALYHRYPQNNQQALPITSTMTTTAAAAAAAASDDGPTITTTTTTSQKRSHRAPKSPRHLLVSSPSRSGYVRCAMWCAPASLKRWLCHAVMPTSM
jgi:hypothetical protein